MNPRYPVFIPTKGRHESRFTIRTFQAAGIPFRIFVEEQEAELYAAHVEESQIVVLPHRDKGLTVTRNWIWDYAAEREYPRFWTFDDNIKGLFRFNFNLKTPMADGTALRIIEDFTDRYENIPIAGMNYFMFASRKCGNQPPIYWNTRVYSNMLIKTQAPFRNVTFFNDDTDLCLRVLKSGSCTALFNAFLIGKAATMTVKGGMTDYYDETDNRMEFVEELRRAHPELVKVTKKWGRWHHHVDYSVFRRNAPALRSGVEVSAEPDNYGMVLEKERADGSWGEIAAPEYW